MAEDDKNIAAPQLQIENCRINPTEDENFLFKEIRRSWIHVEFIDLSYSVYRAEKTKEILQNVTGCFRPGRLTAILGPSGAGKSTLLGIVSSLKSVNVKGSILINGVERDAIFRRNSCLIPQEFALMPLLTTKETLYVAARLKIHRNRKSWSPNMVVNETMEQLGLTECSETLVQNLSGGERKRLAIGIEIMTKPLVLFLDEPTSGLDSASSYQVICMLNAIARTGCTVVCAVHQPSCRMISRFDDILVLDRAKSYYCGPTENVLTTFTDAGYVCPQFYNIAEFVLEVVTGQRGGNLENLYNLSRKRYTDWTAELRPRTGTATNSTGLSPEFLSNGTIDCYVKNKPRRLSVWQEQRILFLRAMLCIKRDNTMTKLRFAAHVAVALLLGVVFYDCGDNASRTSSNIACVFFILLFLYFSSSMPAVQIFPTEAAVFLREYLNNWYRLRSYYLVKVFSDLPLQILCPTTFIGIIYYLTGQPMEYEIFMKTWTICVLMTILGQSSGILTGVAFDTHIGVFLIPALSMPIILFAGFFLKFSEMPFYLKPLCSLSFFRYAFEGILQTIYHEDREKLPCDRMYCIMRSPKIILSSLEMPIVYYHTNVLLLCVWIICLHLTIFSVLKWKAYLASK